MTMDSTLAPSTSRITAGPWTHRGQLKVSVVLHNGSHISVTLPDDLVAQAAQGVPVGGTAGQVLAKIDATNYNTHWISALTQAIADARYLQLAGGTLTGALTLAADPGTNLQAATKQYADTKQTQAQADARYLQLAGGTLSGALVTATYTEIPEIATPATPAAGKVRLYAKADHGLYMLDSTGVERRLDINTLEGTKSYA